MWRHKTSFLTQKNNGTYFLDLSTLESTCRKMFHHFGSAGNRLSVCFYIFPSQNYPFSPAGPQQLSQCRAQASLHASSNNKLRFAKRRGHLYDRPPQTSHKRRRPGKAVCTFEIVDEALIGSDNLLSNVKLFEVKGRKR